MKLKAGDKVVCVNKRPNQVLVVGATYTIKEVFFNDAGEGFIITREIRKEHNYCLSRFKKKQTQMVNK